ncbi:MAG: hypothetical protein CVU89_02655 [Firmicutes bacterium HGW-Firmicutes-14]|nr:MAG: hypothetical protein CVU89_02655 [Firmicutes bacterium HGW-Firmicutes-14]
MDRFKRGLAAGVAGGILMNIWDLTSYYILGLAKERYLDWASIFVFGDLPRNIPEAVYSQLTQLLWVGFLGIVFAYLIPFINSRDYLLKGAFFGFITGFVIYALPVAFKVPYLSRAEFGTVVSHFVGGVTWGTSMAYILHRLDTSARVEK